MPDDHKARMQPKSSAPPGLETDGKGNVIPFDQRTRDNQAAASGVKNPDREAEAPAAMPPGQQGRGPSHPVDPAGRQGGYHR
jgi:hypothetical protein